MTAQLTAPATLPTQEWIWQGHRICHTVQGSGLPLVLIHGFGASIGHWRKNIPELAAAGYQVHAIDLLGFGRSDWPRDSTYTAEAHVDALDEAGVDAADAVMVGDTTFDMHMAVAAGMPFLGVSWGYHPAAQLTQAVTVLDNFDELDRALSDIWKD